MRTLHHSSENSGCGDHAVLWMTVVGIVIAACLAVAA